MKNNKLYLVGGMLFAGVLAAALLWFLSGNNSAGGQTELLTVNTGNDTAQNISILLGKPTQDAITLNVLTAEDGEISVAYSITSAKYNRQSSTTLVKKGVPQEITLTGLLAGTRYFYRLNFKPATLSKWQSTPEHTFQTARVPNSSFTFAIEADPHLDEQTDPLLYRQTLKNVLADKPDFLIDLGDTFMSDKLPAKSYETIKDRHLLLRQYFDIVGADVPLFLALGNHEGESGWELKNGENNLAVWATNLRKQYYPNPVPNSFYSGNSSEEKYVGLREDYYTFSWGDAQFIVLDPYWYTTAKPNNNGWKWTLGKAQYDWLQQVLVNSRAKYKFVFIHQLVGGDNQGRGGVELANLYEWGGYNPDGSYGFDKERPGWGKPVHRLLVENGVNVVFKGHDHFYARQELDGVIYQTLPQPGHEGDKIDTAQQYGYINGQITGGSGYLRVNVSISEVTIQFVKDNEKREIVTSYTIK
jgi:phosphodiesterase/alkaline phosphatase D-like protein